MSGFDLLPVDGGDPVHLPPGDTVLGRGPLLGVSDKRVSRHHGLLENRDGRLRLKPTHLNPCFVQSALTDDPRPLHKDTWFPLQDGDLFSLLPGQFIYRVVSVGGDERTPRNSQMFEEEEEEAPVSAKADVEPASSSIGRKRRQTPPLEEATPAALTDEEEVNRRLNQDEAQGDVAPPTGHRRRVLPAWMTSAASKSPSCSSTAVKRSQRPAASSAATKRAAAKQATPPVTTSPAEAGLSEEEEKRRRKMIDEEELQATTDPKEESDDFPVDEEDGDGNTTLRTSVFSQSANEENKPKPRHQATPRVKPFESGGGSASGPASSRRTPCPYGKDCYRKNPLHFQESSHPGDSDYEEEEEVEAAERPECPYGTDCYRKNPLHRREFKHSQRPARTSRAVAQTSPNDEDEDDGFINDDSDDLGDDSDYVPPDSDDSGKEDVKRLQKEAKAFLKRTK